MNGNSLEAVAKASGASVQPAMGVTLKRQTFQILETSQSYW